MFQNTFAKRFAWLKVCMVCIQCLLAKFNVRERDWLISMVVTNEQAGTVVLNALC